MSSRFEALSVEPEPLHESLPPDVLMAVAARFRVLGTPSRLRVLDRLMAGPMGIGALAAATGLSQSNLSRQVAELERAGCVRRRREGREVTVEVADPSLKALCELVCGSLRDQAEADRDRFGES